MVFERFLYVALREALGLPEREWKRGQGLMLDEDRRISMKPDLSWWPPGAAKNGSRPSFVGDAKYKKLDAEGFEARGHLPDARLLHGGRSALGPAGLRRR